MFKRLQKRNNRALTIRPFDLAQMSRQGVYTARVHGDLVVPPLSLQPRGQDFGALQQHANIIRKNKWLSAGFCIPARFGLIVQC